MRRTGYLTRALVDAARDEAAKLVKKAGGPVLTGETTKARINRTASLLGWEPSRTDDIWHRKARRIDAHEMDALRTITKSR